MTAQEMIFRPRLGDVDVTRAKARSREQRKIEKALRDRFGGVRRLLRARIGRKLEELRALGGLSRLVGGATEAAGLGEAAGGARAIGAAGPLGILVGVLAVAGIVGARIAAGKSFEGIGEELNKLLLGDIDDEARANRTVRESLKADENLSYFVARNGITDQVREMAAGLKEQALQEEKGKSLIREEFWNNSTLIDQLVVRGVDAWKRAWSGRGLDASAKKIGMQIGNAVMLGADSAGALRYR